MDSMWMTKRLKYAGTHLDNDVFERRFESSGQFIYRLSMQNNACIVTISIVRKTITTVEPYHVSKQKVP
jgi:hypothetical protein